MMPINARRLYRAALALFQIVKCTVILRRKMSMNAFPASHSIVF